MTLKALTVMTPTEPGRELVSDLSLSVAAGERLLVVGRSGIGKSSLLRAVAGLWVKGSGKVARPAEAGTMFLSQKPYITLGSLRENVLYPTYIRTYVQCHTYVRTNVRMQNFKRPFTPQT